MMAAASSRSALGLLFLMVLPTKGLEFENDECPVEYSKCGNSDKQKWMMRMQVSYSNVYKLEAASLPGMCVGNHGQCRITPPGTGYASGQLRLVSCEDSAAIEWHFEGSNLQVLTA